MKNWISKLTLALLLTLTFALPAFAWQDHGNTYTAIDGLDSQRLTTQGEVSLPTLSEQFSMGLHVDIVDDLENYSISDYAALFYDQYGYGVGDDQDGAVLMIYVVDQGGTIDFMDYCIYTRGKGSDAMNSDNAANLYAALDLILQGTGRSYEDAGEACANAVDVFSSNIALLMTEQSDPSLLTGDDAETLEPQGAAEHEMEPQGVPEGNEPNTEPDATYAPESEEPAEAPQTAVPTEGVQESESEYAMIFDEAGLLTDSQRLRLENQAQKIASKYDCNPYVLTVDSLDGAAPREFAKTYYQEHALGNGDYRNGILFLVAMESRDYVTITYGRNPNDTSQYGAGILAFTDYGISKMEDDVVPSLSEGEYFAAFQTYLDDCETYLNCYSQGKAFDRGTRLPGAPLFSLMQILIIIFVPLLIALIVCLIFKAQMKTARKATGAGNYLVDGSFQLTKAKDDYIRTTRSTEKIERNNSGSSGGSSGSTVDSDGFGGSSGGKF